MKSNTSSFILLSKSFPSPTAGVPPKLSKLRLSLYPHLLRHHRHHCRHHDHDHPDNDHPDHHDHDDDQEARGGDRSSTEEQCSVKGGLYYK